jgi:hypothetical protein
VNFNREDQVGVFSNDVILSVERMKFDGSVFSCDGCGEKSFRIKVIPGTIAAECDGCGQLHDLFGTSKAIDESYICDKCGEAEWKLICANCGAEPGEAEVAVEREWKDPWATGIPQMIDLEVKVLSLTDGSEYVTKTMYLGQAKAGFPASGWLGNEKFKIIAWREIN